MTNPISRLQNSGERTMPDHAVRSFTPPGTPIPSALAILRPPPELGCIRSTPAAQSAVSEDFEENLNRWISDADENERPDRHVAAQRILDCYRKGLSSLNLSRLCLTSLPEAIGNLQKLEKLSLSGCRSLRELPKSIGNLTELKELSLSACSLLRGLPKSIGNLTELKELSLSACPSITELPEAIGNLRKLEKLSLGRCPLLKELPEAIGNLSKLKKLDLTYCFSLRKLPTSIEYLTELEELDLTDSSSLTELPESIKRLTELKTLCLNGCSSLTELPESIGRLTGLETLSLTGCSSLIELPQSIGRLPKLGILNLGFCSLLRGLPESIGKLTELKKLYLGYCDSFRGLPESIGKLTELKKLYLTGTPISYLPHSISFLCNLTYFCLAQTQIAGVPHEIFDLPNSCTIDLTGCPIPENVLQRIQERISHSGYNGPIISHSVYDTNPMEELPLEEILREICLIAQAPSMFDFDSWPDDSRKVAFSTWLNKVTWTADWKKEEAKEALCKRVVKFLQFAQNDPEFREIFFTTIEGAILSCADRTALSLIDLEVAQEIQPLMKEQDLQKLTQFLLERVYPIELLKAIAREKIPTMSYFDEIEVYLGYLIGVGRKLPNFSLGVQEMLFSSGLSEADINHAHQQVLQSSQDQSKQAMFLANNDYWRKMFQVFYQQEYEDACVADDPAAALLLLAERYIKNRK